MNGGRGGAGGTNTTTTPPQHHNTTDGIGPHGATPTGAHPRTTTPNAASGRQRRAARHVLPRAEAKGGPGRVDQHLVLAGRQRPGDLLLRRLAVGLPQRGQGRLPRPARRRQGPPPWVPGFCLLKKLGWTIPACCSDKIGRRSAGAVEPTSTPNTKQKIRTSLLTTGMHAEREFPESSK